jgi:hypothetical protein
MVESGVGSWELRVGSELQTLMEPPQSPIPNPQSKIY